MKAYVSLHTDAPSKANEVSYPGYERLLLTQSACSDGVVFAEYPCETPILITYAAIYCGDTLIFNARLHHPIELRQGIMPKIVLQENCFPHNEDVQWDYEEDCYQIYSTGSLDDSFENWLLKIPQTIDNNRDVQKIVDRLNRIARRLEAEQESIITTCALCGKELQATVEEDNDYERKPICAECANTKLTVGIFTSENK